MQRYIPILLVVCLSGCAWISDSDVEIASDLDGDGFGGIAFEGTDCDDHDPKVNPDATEEWYDGLDQNCDGLSDYDQDGDGFEDPSHPDGGEDCDDTKAAINPDAAEKWYDGIDRNCDGASDYDKDQDGYDDPQNPEGGDDCNDADATINPGATDEWYDGIDQDCDGASDYDQDSDGYDDPSNPDGGDDCNDVDEDINPGEVELCDDQIDNNCDGSAYGCAFWGPHSATDADFSIQGVNSLDQLSQFALWSGDLTGDGYAEIVAGAREYPGQLADGAIFLFRGSEDWTSDKSATDADLIIEAPESDEYFGRHVWGADGQLIVGTGTTLGAAHLYDATATGVLDTSSAISILEAEAAHDWAGTSVWLGDADGNGTNDAVVGAYAYPQLYVFTGAVYVQYDPQAGTDSLANADVKIEGEAEDDGAGYTIIMEDVSGDGVADLIIGAIFEDTAASEAGAVYVVNGPLPSGTTDLSTADLKLIGAGLDHDFAYSLWASDLNGDDVADIVVGAHNYEEGGADTLGAVYVVSADTAQSEAELAAFAIVRGTTDERLGSSVSAGNLDGTAPDDLIIGAEHDDTIGEDAGVAYIFSGPLEGTRDANTADAILHAEGALDGFGNMVFAADVNNDGFDDAVIGAWWAAARSGKVYGFFGGPGL